MYISTCFSYIFYLSATTFLCAFLSLSNQFYELYHSKVALKLQYEYIIVGTGTAGSIIASGISSENVLIVEAGSMRTGLMDVPLLQPLLQGTSYDWKYRTQPQKNACQALIEGRSRWPMGKVLGGTHMLNNMIHYRAERRDFQGWFEKEENLDEFMKYFAQWGEDEIIEMEEVLFETGLADAFINGANEAGLALELFYRPNMTVKNGKRWTAGHYLWDNFRKNHELILNALVTKIIVENNKATGIILEKSGQIRHVKASKGIILAAGTVGSSKILLQSGIGPKKHLEEMNIKLVADLPVGENLQDHVTTGMDLVLLTEKLSLTPWNLIHPKNLVNYLFYNGKDSSLSFGGCECLGFVNLNSSYTHNLGFMVLPVGITIDTGYHLRNLINLREDVWERYFKVLVEQGHQSVTILPILLHPKSRGFIRLQSTDPHLHPVIEPNYLSKHDDVQTLVVGIKILKQILNQPSMRALGAEINPTPFPGCEKHSFDSDSYWECYVRALTLTLYHPVGTCRMGSENNTEAVVSNRDFKVHKIDNLYVVDGSVMPNLPSGNPNSVVAALAQYFLKAKFPEQG